MKTQFRPLLGPAEWLACEAAVFAMTGPEAVGLTYVHPALGRLNVELHVAAVSAPARFFRNSVMTWQAQERVLYSVPLQREGLVAAEGKQRPVRIAEFAADLWAAQTVDDEPMVVSMAAEDWPVEGLSLVRVPPDAFREDEEEVCLDLSAERYELAKEHYLAAIRKDGRRQETASLAQAAAESAADFNAAADERLHDTEAGDERHQLHLLTERTRALADLWADVATAYE